MNALAELITPHNIAIDIEASTQKELFAFVGALFEKNNGIPAGIVKSCLEARESLGSTGLGQGIAIPHGRVKDLSEAHLGFVRLINGIDFKAPDGKLVQTLIIMLVPEHATQAHLEILSQVAQILSDTSTKKILLTETDPDKIYQLLTAWNK